MPLNPEKLAVVIVLGVSSSGKTTVARTLAERIGFTFKDADEFHSKANIAKMHAGFPLTDEDRRPWLEALANEIDSKTSSRKPFVMACSALKRVYRDILVHDRDDVRLVYLKGSHDLIAKRMAARKHHFMSPTLLDSQFAALEEPTPDENAIYVDVDSSVDYIVDTIIEKLAIHPAKARPA